MLNIGVVNRFNDSVNLIKTVHRRGQARRGLSRLRFLPRASLHPGARRRVYHQGNRRRRRADRLGRALPGHRDVLLRRPEARHGHRRSVLQAGQGYGELRLHATCGPRTPKNVDGTYDVDDSVTGADPHRGPGHHASTARGRRTSARMKRTSISWATRRASACSTVRISPFTPPSTARWWNTSPNSRCAPHFRKRDQRVRRLRSDRQKAALAHRHRHHHRAA